MPDLLLKNSKTIYDELAEIMWKVWTKRSIEEEQELSRKAQEELPGRLIAFAQRYEDIVLETLGKKQKAVLSQS